MAHNYCFDDGSKTNDAQPFDTGIDKPSPIGGIAGASWLNPLIVPEKSTQARAIDKLRLDQEKEQLGKAIQQIKKEYDKKKLAEATKHTSHKRNITKGVTGTFSKIQEEFEEALDAHEQGLRLMEIWELGDLMGAVICYLEKNYKGVTIHDLIHQAEHTNRLFREGKRENRDPK